MQKEMNEIIDADLFNNVIPSHEKKSARIVSVFNQNKLVDCDELQMAGEIQLGRVAL